MASKEGSPLRALSARRCTAERRLFIYPDEQIVGEARGSRIPGRRGARSTERARRMSLRTSADVTSPQNGHLPLQRDEWRPSLTKLSAVAPLLLLPPFLQWRAASFAGGADPFVQLLRAHELLGEE